MNPFDPAALECLAALADSGSFDGAARRLSVTQSAVSQRLRALESSLGRRLVVRARPLRFTEPGKVMLRYARQMQALRADVVRELGAAHDRDEPLPIAINADSLATWVLPALDAVAHDGTREGFGLQLIVDDQDFTHEWLREGAVLGCVSTVDEALRGCSIALLGAMRYVAVASRAFVERELPHGLDRGNFARLPWLVFNRKDDMPAVWAGHAFGIEAPRLTLRSVPSTEAHARAASMGWGIGVMPEQMAERPLRSGELVALHPEVWVDVQLYWHQWKLLADDRPEPTVRSSALERVGHALAAGARLALRGAPG
jgi:LysR family transcriptional regulator (chromosome initiation inhibitor)